MADKVCINDRTYHAIRLAADAVLYSPDYITRLAREHKVAAVRLGRKWFVHIESLQAYASVQELEQTIRQKQLREQRRHEQRLTQRVGLTKRPLVRIEHFATIMVGGILLLGVMVGLNLSNSIGATPNVAALAELAPEEIPAAPASEMLRPTFTNERQNVYVSGDRTVGRPSGEIEWVHVRYE